MNCYYSICFLFCFMISQPLFSEIFVPSHHGSSLRAHRGFDILSGKVRGNCVDWHGEQTKPLNRLFVTLTQLNSENLKQLNNDYEILSLIKNYDLQTKWSSMLNYEASESNDQSSIYANLNIEYIKEKHIFENIEIKNWNNLGDQRKFYKLCGTHFVGGYLVGSSLNVKIKISFRGNISKEEVWTSLNTLFDSVPLSQNHIQKLKTMEIAFETRGFSPEFNSSSDLTLPENLRNYVNKFIEKADQQSGSQVTGYMLEEYQIVNPEIKSPVKDHIDFVKGKAREKIELMESLWNQRSNVQELQGAIQNIDLRAQACMLFPFQENCLM